MASKTTAEESKRLADELNQQASSVDKLDQLAAGGCPFIQQIGDRAFAEFRVGVQIKAEARITSRGNLLDSLEQTLLLGCRQVRGYLTERPLIARWLPIGKGFNRGEEVADLLLRSQ